MYASKLADRFSSCLVAGHNQRHLPAEPVRALQQRTIERADAAGKLMIRVGDVQSFDCHLSLVLPGSQPDGAWDKGQEIENNSWQLAEIVEQRLPLSADNEGSALHREQVENSRHHRKSH